LRANDAFLDMGWDEPMIGLDYDGELHQTSRRRFVHDIGRNELVPPLPASRVVNPAGSRP
jgi:hypothetical protein